jgi:Predicted phosphatases
MEIRDAELTPRLIKKIKFFNGVFQTVGLLKELGISYCIATSMNSRELSKFIPNLKLNSVSEIIINSPRLDLEKPNPFILNKSIKTCKMSKSHTYYVGDSPYDLVASRRAGVHFIGVFNKKELGKHPGFCKDILSLKDRLERNPDALRDKF